MDEENTPLPARPPRADERFMQERFSEAIAEQSKLMTALAQQLLVVELAVLGLYATALKLVNGSDKMLITWEVSFAFICWIAALVLTLVAMIPRLDTEVVRQSPDSIEAFFSRAARRKFVLLIPAIIFFISGIMCIILDLFL
jgi:hypothetical protein